jgi:hypothetical protein
MTALARPLVSPSGARRELARLSRELDDLQLTRRQRHEASAALAAAEAELARSAPDPRRLAGQLARFTTVLRSANALTHGSPRLVHALQRLRLWLGPLPF